MCNTYSNLQPPAVCVSLRKKCGDVEEKKNCTETIKHQKELSIKEDYVRYNTDGMEIRVIFFSFFIIKRLAFLNKTLLLLTHTHTHKLIDHSNTQSSSLPMASISLHLSLTKVGELMS